MLVLLDRALKVRCTSLIISQISISARPTMQTDARSCLLNFWHWKKTLITSMHPSAVLTTGCGSQHGFLLALNQKAVVLQVEKYVLFSATWPQSMHWGQEPCQAVLNKGFSLMSPFIEPPRSRPWKKQVTWLGACCCYLSIPPASQRLLRLLSLSFPLE